MNLAQIEQFQNKTKSHLLFGVCTLQRLAELVQQYALLYPMVKKFSYPQRTVNKTVLLCAHMLSQLFRDMKGTGQLFDKNKAIHSVQFTQRAVSSGCRAVAWELRRKEGQQRARVRLCRKGCSLGGTVPFPAEQGAQPAFQGNIKN